MISSLKDPLVQQIRLLSKRASRVMTGKAVIEGASLIAQSLQGGARVDFILISDSFDHVKFCQEIEKYNVPTYFIRASISKQALNSAISPNVLAVADISVENKIVDATLTNKFVLILDQVVDPGNIGTIGRSAKAFGVQDIILTDHITDVTSRKVIDASRGSLLTSLIYRSDGLQESIDVLHEKGFQIVATSSYGTTLPSLAQLQNKPLALIVGNETAGISPDDVEKSDYVVQIPMEHAVDSLNVGVATGISILELQRSWIKANLKTVVSENSTNLATFPSELENFVALIPGFSLSDLLKLSQDQLTGNQYLSPRAYEALIEFWRAVIFIRS